jgi:hypothetical protein
MKNENDLPSWLIDEMLAYLYMNGPKLRTSDFKSATHLPIKIFPTEVTKS